MLGTDLRIGAHAPRRRDDTTMARLRTLRITRVPRVLTVLLAATILIICAGALIRHSVSQAERPSESADLSGFVAVVLPDFAATDQFLAEGGDPCVESILIHASLERHE